MTTSDYDLRFERFVFGFAGFAPSAIDLVMTLGEKSASDEFMSVYEEAYPVVLRTGLFEKTPYHSLNLNFVIEGDDYDGDSVAIHYENACDLFSVRLLLRKSDASKLLTKHGYKMMCLGLVRQSLEVLCRKFGLDANPILLLPEISCGQAEQPADRVKITQDLTDDVHLHIPIDERKLQALDHLVHDISSVLQEHDIARWDGQESGMGFRTVFFRGRDGVEVFNFLGRFSEKLPKNTFVEVYSNGIKITYNIPEGT